MRPATFIDARRLPYPFCPGCSHGRVLEALDQAMVAAGLELERTVIVTDIGCAGLSDQWFLCHALHGLHGRSMAYAEGLKLADPALKVIVLMGDGGAGIGGHHLLNLAKRNIGVAVVLMNNFNFGMTGGEHSVATPLGALTATTSGGHFEAPLRLCETLALNGAPFVARRGFFDEDLVETLKAALLFDGLAFVEVLELCTAYFSPWNKFGRGEIEKLLAGPLPRLTRVDAARLEYTRAGAEYRKTHTEPERPAAPALEHRFAPRLARPLDLVLAGSAGMKIKSSATTFGKAAILGGLHALQTDDYPVTVQTGHSISCLKLSPGPIGYMGLEAPEALFLISEEGLAKSRRMLRAMGPAQTVYRLSGLSAVESRARLVEVDLARMEGKIPKEYVATALLAAYLRAAAPFPFESLLEALEALPSPKIRDASLLWARRAAETPLIP